MSMTTRTMGCPACGAANRIKFEQFEVLRELPCSECGMPVRWKRRPFGSGGQLRQAFDDYEPELAR